MIKHIIIISIIIILFSNCNNSNSSYQNLPKSEEELKMDLKQIEKLNPKNYLDASGTYKENFLGNKIKVNCVITNSATLTTYKDIEVRVYYYSKTKTLLGTEDYTIYEFVTPSATKTIQMKIANYQDVNSIGWDVIDAISVD